MESTATIWMFSGRFLGGERDCTGTPVADLLTGKFVTRTADRAAAEAALVARYAGTAGEVRITSLVPLASPWSEKMAPRYVKRGGTKEVPLLC